MKNLFLTLVFVLVTATSFADSNVVATTTNDSIENNVDLAQCTIKETRGNSYFYGHGNCHAVLKAYKEWIAAMQ